MLTSEGDPQLVLVLKARKVHVKKANAISGTLLIAPSTSKERDSKEYVVRLHAQEKRAGWTAGGENQINPKTRQARFNKDGFPDAPSILLL